MRYTTIIDISQYPKVYGNINTRVVYLHLVLKSGYHDYDKDQIEIPLRKLACETGLTLSAVRHAIKVLQEYKLLTKVYNRYHVRKWLVDAPITPRAKTAKQVQRREEQAVRDEQNAKLQQEYAQREKEVIELLKKGKTSFMLYYEQLKAKAENGDTDAIALMRRHHAHYVADLQKVREWQEKNMINH